MKQLHNKLLFPKAGSAVAYMLILLIAASLSRCSKAANTSSSFERTDDNPVLRKRRMKHQIYMDSGEQATAKAYPLRLPKVQSDERDLSIWSSFLNMLHCPPGIRKHLHHCRDDSIHDGNSGNNSNSGANTSQHSGNNNGNDDGGNNDDGINDDGGRGVKSSPSPSQTPSDMLSGMPSMFPSSSIISEESEDLDGRGGDNSSNDKCWYGHCGDMSASSNSSHTSADAAIGALTFASVTLLAVYYKRRQDASNQEHLLSGSVKKRRVRFNEVIMRRQKRQNHTDPSHYQEYDDS